MLFILLAFIQASDALIFATPTPEFYLLHTVVYAKCVYACSLLFVDTCFHVFQLFVAITSWSLVSQSIIVVFCQLKELLILLLLYYYYQD